MSKFLSQATGYLANPVSKLLHTYFRVYGLTSVRTPRARASTARIQKGINISPHSISAGTLLAGAISV